MATGENDYDPGYDGSNTTGFVSPAADALEGPIDLAALLDLRRPHRYPVRVLGEALVGVVQNPAFLGYTGRAETAGLRGPDFGGKDVLYGKRRAAAGQARWG